MPNPSQHWYCSRSCSKLIRSNTYSVEDVFLEEIHSESDSLSMVGGESSISVVEVVEVVSVVVLVPVSLDERVCHYIIIISNYCDGRS